VIRVQNEQQVQCFCGDRVYLIFLRWHGEEHVQQVFAVIEVIARIDERLRKCQLERSGCNSRQFGDDSMGKDIARLRAVDVHRVMIISGHGTDYRG